MIKRYLPDWRTNHLVGVLAIVLLSLLAAIPGSGVEYLSNEVDCVKLSGQFMQRMVEGEIEEGFSLVAPYFPVSEQKLENLIEETHSQLMGVKPDFGNALNYKFVSEERVDNFLLRFTFVIKHEFTVTVWHFVYYRPGDKWLLNSLRWNDQVEGLFSTYLK